MDLLYKIPTATVTMGWIETDPQKVLTQHFSSMKTLNTTNEVLSSQHCTRLLYMTTVHDCCTRLLYTTTVHVHKHILPGHCKLQYSRDSLIWPHWFH